MAHLISVKPIKERFTWANETQLNNTNSQYNSPKDQCPINSIIINQSHADVNSTSTQSCESLKNSTTGFGQYTGILCTLISSLNVSFSILLIKILQGYGFDPYGITFWKYLGVTIAIFPVTIFLNWTPSSSKTEDGHKKSVFSSIWPLSTKGNWITFTFLVLNGITGCTSWIFRSSALQFLTIGDVSVITHVRPVLVTIMGHFLLREACGVVPLIIAFTTFAGLVIVARPPFLTGEESFDSYAMIGTSLAVGALLSSSCHSIIVRKFREVHFALTALMLGLVGVIQTTILCFTLGQFAIPQGLQESLVLSAFISVSFVGVVLDILALTFETAGTVAVIRCCEVIFGFILQFIFLGVVPDVYSSIGAAVVLGGILTIAYRKVLSSLPEDNPTRIKWSCFLI